MPVESADQTVLILAPTGRDGVMIRDVLRGAGVEGIICPDLSQACACLEQPRGAMIIAEEALLPGNLSCLFDALKRQPVWSDIPLIFLRAAPAKYRESEHLATQMMSSANVTMLERPLHILTLVSAVQSALRARRRQYQVKDLLQQTQEQVRQRDHFLALLGHELRNPLAAIRTAVEVLCGQGAVNDTATEQHGIIQRQSATLARLVDDLLDVARITAGKITLELSPVRMVDVLRNAIAMLRSAIRPLTQQITLVEADDGAYVHGDPVRLEQVATNLIGNAIKYSPADGRIDIRLFARDGRVVLEVADTGIGIPPEMLPLIFEPFVRVDSEQSRLRGGLGLGLAVVRGLVELHGGTIQARSTGVGRGSGFTISLPQVSAPVGGTAQEKNGHARTGRSVLVIEDGDDTRQAMLALLKMWGHRAQGAVDGPSGVKRAVEARPEVALVDIGLPGLDGYEVARQLRALLGSSIQLVALTGYGQADDKRKAAEAGFDRHLVKPVDPRLLEEVLSG